MRTPPSPPHHCCNRQPSLHLRVWLSLPRKPPCPFSVFRENHGSPSLTSSLPDPVAAPCPVMLCPLGLQSLLLWPEWHLHGLEPTPPPPLTVIPEGSGPVCALVSWVSEGRGGAQVRIRSRVAPTSNESPSCSDVRPRVAEGSHLNRPFV